MFKNRQAPTLKQIISFIALVIVFVGIWYVATHGFIKTTTSTKNTPLTYQKMTTDLSSVITRTSDTRTLLQSGMYSVGIPGKQGILIKQVNVPRFLFTETINNKSRSSVVTILGRNALTNITGNDSALLTYSGSTFRPVNSTNITNDNLGDSVRANYPDFIVSVQLSRNVIAGVTQTSGGLQPIRFDTSTSSTVSYPLLPDTKIEEIRLKPQAQSFSIFNNSKREVSNYGSAVNDVSTFKLSNQAVTTFESSPVYSLSNKILAVATGPNIATTNDNKAPIDKNKHVVSLLNTDTKKIVRSFTIPNAGVADINLSTTSKRVAIHSLGSTGIFSVESGNLEFTIPYPINNFIWLNDSDFVFITRSNGLFNGSIERKEAKTLISYQNVRPTSISFTEGNFVYFTGYGGSIKNADNPDIYKADITKDITDTQLRVLEKFPYQGDGFYVDNLNNSITIQLTRYKPNNQVDEAAQLRALEYVKSVVGDNPNYPVGYSYVDLIF